MAPIHWNCSEISIRHPFITAPSKTTPSKSPSKKVAKIYSPSSPSSPSKRKRLPQANVLKNQSPSKFYPNPQAKSIFGSSPSKPQANFSKIDEIIMEEIDDEEQIVEEIQNSETNTPILIL